MLPNISLCPPLKARDSIVLPPPLPPGSSILLLLHEKKVSTKQWSDRLTNRVVSLFMFCPEREFTGDACTLLLGRGEC